MDPDIDDLELIKMVEQQQCLYVKSCKAYKDMDKPAIWAQIGALLTYPKTGIFIKKSLMSFEIMLECYY